MTSVRENQEGRKAWLVLWESWRREPNSLEELNLPAFVCVLPPQLGRGSVLMIMKALWTIWLPTLDEKIASGADPRRLKPSVGNRCSGGSIVTGCDPFLTARHVENLRVKRNEAGKEDLYFVFPAERGLSGAVNPPRPVVLRHGRRQFEPCC